MQMGVAPMRTVVRRCVLKPSSGQVYSRIWDEETKASMNRGGRLWPSWATSSIKMFAEVGFF